MIDILENTFRTIPQGHLVYEREDFKTALAKQDSSALVSIMYDHMEKAYLTEIKRMENERDIELAKITESVYKTYAMSTPPEMRDLERITITPTAEERSFWGFRRTREGISLELHRK